MIDGQKMSKSLGNVISPQQLIDLFGIDGARYLIARSFPSNGDADVGITRFKERYNADLANNLGNLVSRICKLASNLQFPKNNFQINDDFNNLIDNLKFDEAISWVFSKFIDESNNRLNVVSPWKLEADDPARVAVLTECVNNLRAAAYCLTPVMPETCEKIVTALEGEIKPLEKGLFARIA
jgi:methionyl-tRNA synthetase